MPGKNNNTADVLSRVNRVEVYNLDVSLDLDSETEQDNDRETAIIKKSIKNGDDSDFES